MRKIKNLLKEKKILIFIVVLIAVSFLPIFEEKLKEPIYVFKCDPGVVYTGAGKNAECPVKSIDGFYVNFWQKFVLGVEGNRR